MNDLLPIFFFLIFAVLGIGITIFNHERNISRIKSEVIRKGFKVGQVRRRWIDFDENTASYDVTYFDSQGFSQQTRCKIRNIFLFPGSLYWTHPLQDATGTSNGLSSVQQLELDALRKENARLRDNQVGGLPDSTDIPALKEVENGRSTAPVPPKFIADLEIDGLRKENTELKRQLRILKDQNKRYREQLGI